MAALDGRHGRRADHWLRVGAAALVVLGSTLVTSGFLWRTTGPAGASATAPRPLTSVNGYGPGIGTQNPGQHWGGAYTLEGVPGYAYCIEPGGADPLELPTALWAPVPYPGSAVYSSGEMAALAYFAERYQGGGYPGWTVNDTVAAIAEVAYGSAGGITPENEQAPTQLVSLIEEYMTLYAGPWSMQLTMTPPSGTVFVAGANYDGTVTVTSATGHGIPGLQLIAPPTGGPNDNQVSNFVWLASTTNSAGQISFQWNIAGIPAAFAGIFSAQGIGITGGGVGTAPPTYAAPAGSGGQLMIVSGASATPSVEFGGIVKQQQVETGTLSVQKTVPDPAYYGPGGAVFAVETAGGTLVDTLTTAPTGSTAFSTPLTAAPSGTPYLVRETTAPPGYGLAPADTVTVFPGQNTVDELTGTYEEPAIPAQLGAEKTDAQTGQPLAGATFTFAFDPLDNGDYDEALGSCTTSSAGTCQPPIENTIGGWLAGWYQVTESVPPPGYWLDPTTSVQQVFLQPGATDVASVSFGDELLGSLQLMKSGNDTAYWPVVGAEFSVTGPAPSQNLAGTLIVGADDTTNTLSGLSPGTYTVTETTPPAGYSAVPPFTVAVSTGHATTVATVDDSVQPGTITIVKRDAETSQPLAGATFDLYFDPTANGVFNEIGQCVTGSAGTCTPQPNDGTGFLPGDYRITEVSAPSGYFLPTPAPSQTVVVLPGASATVFFDDHLLVPAAFAKVATGNYNPTQLSLAGAVIDVTAGSAPGGPLVTSCTTGTTGKCATGATLQSGEPYCWQEVAAPLGLQSGASGCFTANNGQAAQPITVVDPGLFVGVTVKKVDATDPTVALAGAVYDLYRVDGGTGPPAPIPPAGTPAEPGQTWVARSTTANDGQATFPLQLPGYAYCVAELQAPPGYVLQTTEHCTGVLEGSAQVPAQQTLMTLSDTEAEVTVSAHKFNAAAPGTGIPGAVYDLYVEGAGPPSGPPGPTPQGAALVPGNTYWGTGITDTRGLLTFAVPAGYAWCFKEVSAPVDYDLDTGLHCTAVITVGAPTAATTIAIPETPATVYLGAHKYNAEQPATVIAGATYELLLEGPPPAGYSMVSPPAGVPVPTGDTYWTQGTTDSVGELSFAVPAGHRWCLREIVAPPGYQPDTSYHCTALITSDTVTDPSMLALPEIPTSVPPGLAFTGSPSLLSGGIGAVLVIGGALICIERRRRRRAASTVSR